MSAIRQWAFSLCAAMVAAGMVQMLIPKSGMEKMMRLVVSVFFLCALLSPVLLHDPALFVEFQAGAQAEADTRSREVTQLARQQAENAARVALEKLVRENLAQRGIKAQGITINIITKGQEEIGLESVELLLSPEVPEAWPRLAEELEKELGAPVRLETE